jgi:predicted ATP-binding protein involved in virulence
MSVRLSSFRVFGLFGQYDHDIPLNMSERVTAIIGPNGRGKTICLRLIHALYKRQFSVFRSVDFERVEFSFDNGRKVVVRPSALAPDDDHDEKPVGVLFELINEYGETVKNWRQKSRLRPSATSMITHYLNEVITRAGPSEWTDDRTGERLTLLEVGERFSDVLPESVFESRDEDEPKEFSELIQDVDCHLIETQRLLIVNSEDVRYIDVRYQRRPKQSQLMVQEKATKLRDILQKQISAYATLSQRLDRSFPMRLIQKGPKPQMADAAIKDQLTDLEKKRSELVSAGILDADIEPQINQQSIVSGFNEVLQIYVADTAEKLSVFDVLLTKIKLFREIIADRFIGKSIQLDSKEGIQISSTFTDKPIPLDKLSSGEQHQIVLVFELLFELKENSLILIDEPELSLHVRWQKKFIGDLMRIIQLNHFDVILATHSPQLISRWNNLAVQLGNVNKS